MCAETTMAPLKQTASPPAVLEDSSPAETIEHLYRSHGAWLRRALQRRFGGAVSEIAEDLVQETYLRLAPRKLAVAIHRPRALLMRIASNLALDHLRRRQVDARALERARLSAATRPSAHQSAEPLAVLELSEAIVALPEPLRDVFVLSRFGGLTYEEIADHCGLSVKTVEWRMSRALALCAECLKGEKA
jgi:RNA polymerase sigma factor (sigma-70 family)